VRLVARRGQGKRSGQFEEATFRSCITSSSKSLVVMQVVILGWLNITPSKLGSCLRTPSTGRSKSGVAPSASGGKPRSRISREPSCFLAHETDSPCYCPHHEHRRSPAPIAKAKQTTSIEAGNRP
jgi:hypothetical protein